MKHVPPSATDAPEKTPVFHTSRDRRAGHTMIGLTLHAADQPGALRETRALAQRLRDRHRATNIGE
ncbi:MAG: hypothetical protein HLUCCA12_12010 [Rhodobacteraceae bacterium HLUCCA12]|nr:MAG: hypothetical protein HLUCCA12_12010 [Rhodobacteraceae bacterium HLUCCA12]